MDAKVCQHAVIQPLQAHAVIQPLQAADGVSLLQMCRAAVQTASDDV